MIKKIFKSLLLFGVLLIPCFSNASEMLGEGMIQVNIPEEVNISGRGYSFYLDGNIYTDGYGQYLYWKNNGTSKTLQYIFGWDNGRLYFFGTTTDLNNRITQGYINSFCKSSSVSGCYPDGNSYTIVSADDFYSLNPSITKIAVGNTSVALDWSNNDWGFYLCYFNNNDSNYYCAISAPVPSGGNVKWSSLTGSLGFTSIDNAKNYQWSLNSFDHTFIPIQDTVDITDQDIIDYYEDNPVYSFNKDMCYIGTRDLSSNYEDRITYYQGSGYTIYEFFEQLYGNNFKLSDLDSWLNSWLVNFNTFFNGNNRYSDGTPWYVLRYNGIGNILLDKNNLDNPFLNNKSAYYFMASTIYDSYKGYDLDPNSEDIAVYCYKKTNVSSDIEFDAPNGIRNNIGNWVNQKNKGIGVGFSGWSIVEGESWNGTPLDYFTGNDIVYTGFNSFFKSSFNRFAGVFQGLDPSDLALGQIPSYIVGFLLLLILFRFLSH